MLSGGQAMLEALRKNPRNVYEEGSAFFLQGTPQCKGEEGCKVTVEVRGIADKEKKDRQLTMLTCTLYQTGMCDYYYPYVSSGVGKVTIPKKAPKGTLVVTSVMNGCAMAVYDNTPTQETMIFCHDADAKTITTEKDKYQLLKEENLVRRLESNYEIPKDEFTKYKQEQQKKFDDGLTPTGYGTCYIAIKKDDTTWGVLATTIKQGKLTEESPLYYHIWKLSYSEFVEFAKKA